VQAGEGGRGFQAFLHSRKRRSDVKEACADFLKIQIFTVWGLERTEGTLKYLLCQLISF